MLWGLVILRLGVVITQIHWMFYAYPEHFMVTDLQSLLNRERKHRRYIRRWVISKLKDRILEQINLNLPIVGRASNLPYAVTARGLFDGNASFTNLQFDFLWGPRAEKLQSAQTVILDEFGLHKQSNEALLETLFYIRWWVIEKPETTLSLEEIAELEARRSRSVIHWLKTNHFEEAE